MLMAIDAIVFKEPALKYGLELGLKKFTALLRTDPDKAHAYGKALLNAGSEELFDYKRFTSIIDWDLNEPFLKPESYALGADAYQKFIDLLPYPEISEVTVYYTRMAEWYGKAGNKKKEIRAHKKAIKYLKKRR
jgi:hypothetical protein